MPNSLHQTPSSVGPLANMCGQDFKNQRLVLNSLMTIMCEFDTLGESSGYINANENPDNSKIAPYEIIADIWNIVDASFNQVMSLQIHLQPSHFLFTFRSFLNNIHGLFQGIYRERQFSWMLYNGLLKDGSQLKNFIENILCGTEVIMSSQPNITLEDKLALSKAVLKLLREITDDQDGRIEYQTKQFDPYILARFLLKVSYSCLGILKEVDINQGHKTIINQAN